MCPIYRLFAIVRVQWRSEAAGESGTRSVCRRGHLPNGRPAERCRRQGGTAHLPAVCTWRAQRQDGGSRLAWRAGETDLGADGGAGG